MNSRLSTLPPYQNLHAQTQTPYINSPLSLRFLCSLLIKYNYNSGAPVLECSSQVLRYSSDSYINSATLQVAPTTQLRLTTTREMNTMDLRYIIPPMVNFILFWLLGSWKWELVASSISVQQFSVLELVFVMTLLLLFLFTSAEIPLNVNPIHLRAGHFSIALTMSLMASVFLPPSLFWAVYLLIVFLSPWHQMLFEVLKHFFRLLSNALKLIPPCTITFLAQNEESPTPGSARLEDDVDPELGVRATHEGNQQN